MKITHPVVCYCCEKAVDNWRLERNFKNTVYEVEVTCHGEKDLIVVQPEDMEKLPVVAFKPPEGEPIDTGKWARLAYINADFRRADDLILKAIMGGA